MESSAIAVDDSEFIRTPVLRLALRCRKPNPEDLGWRVRNVGKILIVDDETTYSYALCEILRADGFETEWASGAKQALESLRDSIPELLLVDILLPDMNGLALIRLIREQPDLAQIPIIVISGRTMQDDRAQTMLAGADAFLPKPFSRNQLREAIHPFLPAMIPPASVSSTFPD